MKPAWMIAISVLAAASIASAKTADEINASGTPQQKGQLVAAELAARNAGYRDLSADVEMVLRDAGGGEAHRRFTLKVLERPDASSGDQSLIAFEGPADVKGTAVLSHAKPEGEDDQWLYLPSVHRVKRVSSSNRTGSFVGSEFSFEDLTGNESRKYSWSLLGVEACNQQQCFSVEATPRDAASAYSRRVLRIDTTEFRVQAVDFYDRKGALAKTLTYDGYEKLNGKYWRARSWTMKNHQSGKSTVLTFAAMRLNNGFPASDFASAKLGN